VIDKIHRAIAWLVSILSEKDGSGSSSRVAMMFVILAASFSLVFYTVIARKLPDGNVLLGLSGLVTAGASLYGANAWKNRPQTSDPNTPAASGKGTDVSNYTRTP
jgi:hypothetical protein